MGLALTSQGMLEHATAFLREAARRGHARAALMLAKVLTASHDLELAAARGTERAS
jgi:hypothetical protein